MIGGAGRRIASGCATETKIDEKITVSLAIADTDSIATGITARP